MTNDEFARKACIAAAQTVRDKMTQCPGPPHGPLSEFTRLDVARHLLHARLALEAVKAYVGCGTSYNGEPEYLLYEKLYLLVRGVAEDLLAVEEPIDGKMLSTLLEVISEEAQNLMGCYR